MTAILRAESRALARGTAVLAGAFAVLTAFLVAVFPAMAAEAELLEAAFPEYVGGFFGFEALHTMEGFVGSYAFPFIWILFVGVYFGYLGGGMIAGDVRARRLDLLLAGPVSRESVVIQKFAALWVPLLGLHLAVFAVIVGGAAIIDESIDIGLLVAAHLFSIPYLLVCAGIGLVLSVVLSRREHAQAGALGVIFLLWLLDGISEYDPDLAWLSDLTPSHYYDPVAILVHEELPLADAAILLGAFLALIVIAIILFVRRDL